MDQLSGKDIKGYELRERIGAGGFGAVYRAYQSTVGREVAIKFILPGFASQPDFIRRFETEAQLVARLEHPHITPLYDYWRDPDGAYLVMRWLRGGSLRQTLQDGVYDLRSTALLLDQVSSALALAHRNGVIHRDLKPGNILLDEDGNAYLADFGIAKDLKLKSNHTQPDAIVGSLDYISPEQARSEPVTARTDIYSLGVVLYELLTGQHPFVNISSVERLYKHINDPLPAITGLDDSVEDAINTVIQKATAKNPDNRYADALAFAADFREAAGLNRTPTGQTVEALFTPREHEILSLIIKGLSNKEIAQQLTVTVGTVKWYVNQIYAKLHVRSRVQAIIRARELNLIVNTVTVEADEAVSSVFDGEIENPYKGLRAFQTADEQDFFGRSEQTQKLLNRMGEAAAYQPDLMGKRRIESEAPTHARFLAVVGPSGSGKSSLVKAGLIPALWRGELPGSEKWFVVELLPGAHPLDRLEVALMRIAANQTASLNEQLARDERGLLRATDLILPNDGSELVLVIDQFEEVFTLVNDEGERQHFLNLLAAAVNDVRSRVRVVVTLRADFYDRPLNYPEMGELVRSRMETVMPLSAKGLERAITGPAERVGMRFEPGLVAVMVSEMNYQAGALPLLQYALTELFERREGRLLTQKAYQEIGGAVGALAKRAEELYRDLTPEGQDAVRQMFLRLVTLGEGVEDTRRRAARSEFLAITANTELMDEIIDLYAGHRLLSLDNDAATRSPTVELAHEAILREWERLRGWLNESRDDIKQQRQLSLRAEEWWAEKKDATLLARGLRLDQLEKWAAETKLAITPAERAYFEASVAQRALEQQAEQDRQAREVRLEKRSQTFLRGLVVVLLLATLGAIGLTANAVNSANIAQTEREHVEEAQATLNANFLHVDALRLASEANARLASNAVDVNTTTLLALRALRNGYLPEADQVLQKILQNGLPLYTLRHPSVAVSNYPTHDGQFSPDGRLIVTADDNGVVLVWDAQTGEKLRALVGHTQGVFTARFSPDSRTILTASADHTVRLWDAQTGQQLHEYDHPGVVAQASFSPDGSQFVSDGEDDTIRLWDIQSGEVVKQLAGHHGFDDSVIYAPDGQSILSSGDDGNIRLWNAETGELIREYTGHSGWIQSLAFNADGSQFLSGSADKTGRLWDTNTGEVLQDFKCDHEVGVAFSADDRYGLIGCNAFVQLWDMTTRQMERQVQVSFASNRVAFSPDGKYFLTNSMVDDAVFMWETHPQSDPRIIPTNSFTNGIALSPDGHRLLAAEDAELALWNYDSGEQLWRDTDFDSHINLVAFSPDGRYAAAASDPDAYLFDAATGKEIRRFVGHTDEVLGLDFSPDGKQLVTASFDGTVRLWDVETGQTIWNIVGSTSKAVGAAFSPDGRTIITGSHDNIAHLWDAATGKEIRQFVHPASVYGVAFSHDGKWIATAGWDGIARIWDVETGAEARQFVGHTGVVGGVVFSPDDHYLLSAGDSTIRLWDAQTGQQLRAFYHDGDGNASGLAFSHDGQSVIGATWDGGTRIWKRDFQAYVEQICSTLTRDFRYEVRKLYGIADWDPTCPSNPAIVPAETSVESVYAIGDFQRAVGCIGDIIPDCALTKMQDEDGDGVYTLTINNFPIGNWSYIAGLNGRDVDVYGPNGARARIAQRFVVTKANTAVTFSFKAEKKELGVTTSDDTPSS